MTAFSVTQDVGATPQAILAKLEKPDSKESAAKKIEANQRNEPEVWKIFKGYLLGVTLRLVSLTLTLTLTLILFDEHRGIPLPQAMAAREIVFFFNSVNTCAVAIVFAVVGCY